MTTTDYRDALAACQDNLRATQDENVELRKQLAKERAAHTLTRWRMYLETCKCEHGFDVPAGSHRDGCPYRIAMTATSAFGKIGKNNEKTKS